MVAHDDGAARRILWISVALCGYPFLITWRIARRFGGRGLAVALCVAAVPGPLRNSWYAAKFPAWGFYARDLRQCLRSQGHTFCWGL